VADVLIIIIENIN